MNVFFLCMFCCCFVLFLALIAENYGTKFVCLQVFCKDRFTATVKQLSSTLSGDHFSSMQSYSLK